MFRRDIAQEGSELGGTLQDEVFLLGIDILEHLVVRHFDLDG